MGELHAEFSIDQRARTAHIDLASNGTIVTTYSLANDVFTLSAISVYINYSRYCIGYLARYNN